LDLSIIIVNYNVKEFLQNLLTSIVKASTRLLVETIVVDNASDDGSVEMLKKYFPSVKLIESSVNLGFSKANNIGLKEARGKYILLLNPDTLVSENTFEVMINFLRQHPEVGMAGCKILNPDGTLQLACRRGFPGIWTSFCKVTGLGSLFPNSQIFARYNLTYLNENKTYEVDAISGSFMMIRRELYEKMGGLDEQFFMYGEDLDWCYRTQKAGFRVFYVHSTQIIHYKGESTKRSSIDETRIFYGAMRLFVRKHLAASFFGEAVLSLAISAREFLAFFGRWKLAIWATILDFLVFDISLYVSERSYQYSNHWRGFPDSADVYVYLVPVVSHIFIGSLVGNYSREKLSILRTFFATVASFIFLSAALYFFKDFGYSRAVLLMAYFGALLLSVLWRAAAKIGAKIGVGDSMYTNKKTIIVGTTSIAQKIAEKLNSSNTHTNVVAGFIGNTNKELGQKLQGVEIIGTVETIKKVVEERKIREIIFSVDDLSYSKMMKIVSAMQNSDVDFKVAGSNMQYLVGKSEVSLLDDIPLVELSYSLFNPSNRILKRLFDVVASLIILFLLRPFAALFLKRLKDRDEFKRIMYNAGSVLRGSWSVVGAKEPSGKEGQFVGKQGLTGLWFTEGDDSKNMEKLNVFYARNHNIWLDVEIVSKTFMKLFMRR
jgi:O-antigen biosynthesis protein